jgi:hypothetical protein
MHPSANLLGDSLFMEPDAHCVFSVVCRKKLQNSHQMFKIELIFKENPERHLSQTGQEAQLGTSSSPDDAVSSGNIG